ncbi:MAG: hypothetical protein R3Y64_07580 [Peptostreptococcaceae bacterium]
MRYNENERMAMSNDIYMLGILATERKNYPRIGIDNEAVSLTSDFKLEKPNVMFFIEPLSNHPSFGLEINRDKFDLRNDLNDLYVGFDNQHFNSSIAPFGNMDNKYAYSTSLESYQSKSGQEKKDAVYDALEFKIILFKANIQHSYNTPYEYNKNLKIESIYEMGDGYGEYYTFPDIKDLSFENKLYTNKKIKFSHYNHELEGPKAVICNDYVYLLNSDSWEKVFGTRDEWIYNGDTSKIVKKPFNVSDDYYDFEVIRNVDNIIFIDVGVFDNEIDVEITYDQNEFNFLNDFKNTTLKKGLFYDFNDLVNIHTSIKTNPLTILSGMSGNGKSQVVMSYVETLTDNNLESTNCLFLPVSPSFIEPKDILGELDPRSNSYISSETGLVDFLIEAERNEDKLYFVIFDEMNLGQVEYWFSPFISILELKENRKLNLFNEKSRCINGYKSDIKIGDNIRFIGTVNIDETTKDFSDRLLDRANLVTLKRGSLKEYKEAVNKTKICDIQTNTYYDFLDYKSWLSSQGNGFSDLEVEFLDELHILINEVYPQKGVSFRTCINIEYYLKNIPFNDIGESIIKREDAFDLQIKQRILTKLKGSYQELNDLMHKFYTFFDKYSEIGEFDACKKDIHKKIKELDLYGYAN